MSQIETFIQKWFKYLYPGNSGTGSKNAMAMISEIKTHPAIETLIENPLMLTAICILYHDGKELPGQRAELYKKFIDNLLYRRFTESETIHDYLRMLAFEMHTTHLKAVAKQFAVDVLKSIFKATPEEPEKEHKRRVEKLFDEIEPKCGLLKLENGQYNFWHLTFQEFLAADYIIDNHSNHIDAIQPYWWNNWYNEMIELYIGYLSMEHKKTANDIVETALNEHDKSPFMRFRVAAHSLLDMHKNRRSGDVIEKSRQRMQEIIEKPITRKYWWMQVKISVGLTISGI